MDGSVPTRTHQDRVDDGLAPDGHLRRPRCPPGQERGQVELALARALVQQLRLERKVYNSNSMDPIAFKSMLTRQKMTS